MIAPDVNILIDAYNTKSRLHKAARASWEEILTLPRPVGLSCAVILGFLALRLTGDSRKPNATGGLLVSFNLVPSAPSGSQV